MVRFPTRLLVNEILQPGLDDDQVANRAATEILGSTTDAIKFPGEQASTAPALRPQRSRWAVSARARPTEGGQ